MDTKAALAKLLKIAQTQQLVLEKLAQTNAVVSPAAQSSMPVAAKVSLDPTMLQRGVDSLAGAPGVLQVAHADLVGEKAELDLAFNGKDPRGKAAFDRVAPKLNQVLTQLGKLKDQAGQEHPVSSVDVRPMPR